MSTENAAKPDLSDFAQVIGDAVAAGIAKNTPKKVSFGDYQKRVNSPFNKKHLKLSRICYQNGQQLSEKNLHSEEIELLNRITHSGRYIDRKVEVIVNNDNADETVDIRFANKRDAAVELKSFVRNFTDMLQQIVTAQEAEDADMNAKVEEKIAKRTFGESKASREAREKAGVQ